MEYKACGPARSNGLLRWVKSLNMQMTSLGFDQAGNQADECCFARPVGPKQAEQFATGHLYGKAIDGCLLPPAKLQAFGL